MAKRKLGHHIGRHAKTLDERMQALFSEDDDTPFSLDDESSDEPAALEPTAFLPRGKLGRPKLQGNRSLRRQIRDEAIRDRLDGADMVGVLLPRKLKSQLKWAAHYHATTMRSVVVKALRHYLRRHLTTPQDAEFI